MELESKWNTSLFSLASLSTPTFSSSLWGGSGHLETLDLALSLFHHRHLLSLVPLLRSFGATAFGFINLPKQEVPKGGQTLVVKNLLWLVWKMNKWAHYFPVALRRRTVCLIKCRSRQSQPGLTCTFYLSFCLSVEFKCVMNKAAVIWNIIPLHWWNYKDGRSSQITLIVFYHERCPCWSCGAWRKGRLGMK